MTDDTYRLAQIRARVEAATPGPWDVNGDMCVIHPIDDDDPELVADNLYSRDATFIAHSRQDIPYLLDLVGSLTEDLELADRTRASLTLAQQFTRHDLETVVAERDALRAAVEEAREYLTSDHDLNTRQEVAQAVLTILDRGPKESEES